MRILIADDHAVVRRGVREIIEESFPQTEVSEAGDVPETLQQVRADQWDVLILDITMPGGSGLDALKDIRSLRPGLPVVVLSMHPEDQYAVRVLKAGASGYLSKGAEPAEIVQAVRKALAGRRYVSAELAEKLAQSLSATSEGPPHEALSDREYQVMLALAAGKSVSQIGQELSLSVKTISTYRARVLVKMGLKTNADLTRYAIDCNLLA